jgi:putative FmdB family regulatory protein
MPTYSYHCTKCSNNFELFFYIKDYTPEPTCKFCKSKKTHRAYIKDVISQSCSVRKSDNELKTIGDLALRNTERMSSDEKAHLYMKHNSYKESIEESKPLPKGMTRIKKPPKTIWPGSINKKHRRQPKNGK